MIAAVEHGDIVGIVADESRENDRVLRTYDCTCVAAIVTDLAVGSGRSLYNDGSKRV
jgi:hypothetical protein